MRRVVLLVSCRWALVVVACAMLSFMWPLWADAAAADQGRAEFALGPGDTVKFDILDDDREPVDLLVGTNGEIQTPFLGAMPVSGLTISEAKEELKKRYREEEIFAVPRIAVSVASYRPVYVIGDVRTPGSYPFQADLTVEKALGLAGGQVMAATSSDPVAARARLRAELDVVSMAIARHALAIGRLNALLAGRTDIMPDDIPAEAGAYVIGPIADSLREVELNILRSDVASMEAQKSILTQGIAEATRGQSILEQLSEKTTESLGFSRAELERAKGLQAKGIKTVSEVSNVERQLMLEETRHLQVLANISEGRRGLLNLKRQLAEIDEARRIKAFSDLLLEKTNLAKGIAELRSAEEQLTLLSNRSMDELRKQREVVLDFTIRHGSGTSVADIEAESSTVLSPGDVLVVSIRYPTDEKVAAFPADASPSR